MVLKPRTWEEGTQALVTWTVETAFGPQQWSEGGGSDCRSFSQGPYWKEPVHKHILTQ